MIAQAKVWAASLGKTVGLWISDKQAAFLTGIAAEFPGVPHRYCDNHFLRDVAKPVLEADSHAKVQMRRKVRGLRKVEQAILEHQREAAEASSTTRDSHAMIHASVDTKDIVLYYFAVVRGILNDDQGGPLHPPGLRMAEALGEVRESIQRNLDEKKGGSRKPNSADSASASTADWTMSDSSKSRSAPPSEKLPKSPRPSNPKRATARGVKKSSKS